jgi:aspartate carbamoyltransferase regulatory subunit
MNYFTKDELENILTCVNAISYNNKESEITLKSSKEKLISLINNYCDHPVSYIDYDYQLTRCEKCLEIIE